MSKGTAIGFFCQTFGQGFLDKAYYVEVPRGGISFKLESSVTKRRRNWEHEAGPLCKRIWKTPLPNASSDQWFCAEDPWGVPCLCRRQTGMHLETLVPSKTLCSINSSDGHRTRLHLGKVHRRTSKKFCAFLDVYFCLVLLYFQGKKTSNKLLRNLSLV